jgi:pimeloyl-ACP methyl ester carboxylesterase
MPFYDVTGQKIHAHETGRIGKQLVLLIHGWSSSWYAMSPLITHFHRRYHCVAVDLPGFGESPKSDKAASIETYAELMADLIRQINPNQKAILVGHSMGGMISLTLALRHPELVERMVLLCPTISGHLSLFMNLFISPVVVLEWVPLLDAISGLLEPMLVGITDRLMRPASLSEGSGIDMKDYERLREDARRPGQGRIRAECFWAMRHGDMRGKLKNLANIPALVIWGMEDNTVPLKDASALVQEWPDIDLRILPRVSHWPQFEAPEITQRYVKGFLSRPLNLIQAIF